MPSVKANGACEYSQIWNKVNKKPSPTVMPSMRDACFMLPSRISWCAQVTVNPEVNRIIVLSSGRSNVCDVPDLSLLPIYVAGVKTVTFHAALEAWWEQLALWAMGWLTRLRVVRSWRRCVPLFLYVSERLIRFGSDAGGMHIRLSGTDSAGKMKACTWYLTASRNHGPEIPCSPALVLVRKLVRNETLHRGALACLGLMTLDDFAEEVKDLDISWEVVG